MEQRDTVLTESEKAGKKAGYGMRGCVVEAVGQYSRGMGHIREHMKNKVEVPGPPRPSVWEAKINQ